MSSSGGSGLVGCGQTSATWLPSTMRLPPSTGPSGSRERRSFAFVREDPGLPNAHEGAIHAPKKSLDVEHDSKSKEKDKRAWQLSTSLQKFTNVFSSSILSAE